MSDPGLRRSEPARMRSLIDGAASVAADGGR